MNNPFQYTVKIIVPTVYYRAMLRSRAQYCHGNSSVCLRLSVTLNYCDHIGWNTSKIISPLINHTLHYRP